MAANAQRRVELERLTTENQELRQDLENTLARVAELEERLSEVEEHAKPTRSTRGKS